MSGRRAVLIALTVTVLAGCRGTPIPPTYTQDELKTTCQRQGGYWRPDGIAGGDCEFRGP